MNKKVLLIIGSSRKKKNTYVFSKSFANSFESRGLKTEIIYTVDHYKAISSDVLQKTENADIIGFLTPLYADF